MARKATSKPGTGTSQSSATIGFEAKLWLAADKLRNNMDAAEYKHVVLGLIFLKYISDTFDEHHAKLVEGKGDYAGANPEDQDEYKAENVFWVPPAARWAYLQGSAKLPTIGKIIDDAMDALERDNPRLKGALNKNYGRPDLDKHRLGELIDLIGSIQLADVASKSKDVLGRVFEYFLTQFASAEGKNGGQFYTPSCIVRLLVEMLASYKGRIYDPACGSGGMFVQSEKFVESHGGKLGDISIYGQESNPTTRRLAIMNLAPQGMAGFVLANGSMSSNQSGEGDIRQAIIEADLVDCMVALPGQLFYSTQIPVCLWFLTRSKGARTLLSASGKKEFLRARKRETLFIDARKMGTLIDRVHRELTEEDIEKIVTTYHDWKKDDDALLKDAKKQGVCLELALPYADIPGFCKSATTAEIAAHGYVLTPGRYVGAEEVEDEGEPFEEKMTRLVAELQGQFKESEKLDKAIQANLRGLGYAG